jgi:hypothetical protein
MERGIELPLEVCMSSYKRFQKILVLIIKESQASVREVFLLRNIELTVEIRMKSIVLKTMALSAILGTCVTAYADDYRMVHACKINEGKTMDDVRADNSKWVAFMNENVDGGGITSHITTTVVGDSAPGTFGYVDTFPSLESWTATIALESTAEGIAILEELQESASCTESQLQKAEES